MNIITDTVNQCKRCPQNAMTEDPTNIWPSTTIPYYVDSRLSKITCMTIIHVYILKLYCIVVMQEKGQYSTTNEWNL